MDDFISDIFLNLLNLSISASWLILAVVILRFIFKKAPKWVNCLLWAIAGLRLVLPFSIESIFSLVPSAETVPPEIIYEASPEIHSGIPALNSAVNPIIGSTLAPDPASSANPLQIITYIAAYLWAIGVAVLIVYMLISYLRLRYKMRTATLMTDNIFQSEFVGSPFVLGIFKPKIYLSYDIGDSDIDHVIAHEGAHIKRKDYLIKPIAYLILCVYWFNPIIWLAYALLCRDIEMACDEKVIKEMNEESRKDYSEALFNCSVNRRRIVACPLAFGEVGVKDRIKSVMSYKKPAFWVIIMAIVCCVVTAVCFLTNPVKDVQLFGAVYDSGTAVYTHMDATFLSGTNYYEISENGDLWNIKDDGEYSWLGVLIESDMTKDELLGYIPEEKQNEVNTGRIKKVYELAVDGVIDESKDIRTIFFVTLNGEIYQAVIMKVDTEEILMALLLHEKSDSGHLIGSSEYSAVIDTITADIDGDGKRENCVLTYGPTSGLYTVVFTATEVGSEKAEYINTFNMPYTDGTEFYETDKGQVQLKCGNSIYQSVVSAETEDVYLDIKIEDGNIALYDGEEKIPYWGEQGITPSEFFKKLNALENALSNAVVENNKNSYIISGMNPENAAAFEAHEILHRSKDDEKDTLTVYALTLYEEFNLENAKVISIASGASPVEVVFDIVEDGVYKLKKYRPLGKGDDIENYIPDDYEFDDAEIMDNLQFETRRQANEHYGYLDGDTIHEDETRAITFLEVGHKEMEDMFADFKNSETEYFESDHAVGFKRRVFDGDFYYYCGYKNEEDMVFVFFRGYNLKPVCIIDFNETFPESKKLRRQNSEEYDRYKSMILDIDKNP